MFKIKYVKHLLTIVLCVIILLSVFSLNVCASNTGGNMDFYASEADLYCYYINEETQSEVPVTPRIDIFTWKEKDAFRIIVPSADGPLDSTGPMRFVESFTLPQLHADHEYTLDFWYAFNTAPFGSLFVVLEVLDGNQNIIFTQDLYSSENVAQDTWTECNINFKPDLSAVQSGYSCRLVFRFSQSHNLSPWTVHLSNYIYFNDNDDNSSFFNGVLYWLKKIDSDILDLISKFLEFNTNFDNFLTNFNLSESSLNWLEKIDSDILDLNSKFLEFNTNFTDFLTKFINYSDSSLNLLEKIDSDILDLNSKLFEFNTNFGDFLTDFLNFSDSFKLTLNDLIDFTDSFNTNLTDILDLSFDNFFSHIFSDINISLGLINNSVNNSNNSVNETLNNIDNSITNIDNSISQIGSTLDEISGSVSQGFDELIQGEEVNPDDFSTEGTDSINNISDELESAESQLPQLTESDLTDNFDLSILSELNKGFIALNNVFDLVTSSLGFTSVLVFLLGFGLAVYILGRRLGS